MNRRLALLLLFAAITFALAPLVTPPFTGYRPGQFPVEIVTPAIQPASYAFSIWLVIYAWLILHAAFGLWQRADHPGWARPRWPLIIAMLLGTLWLTIAGASPIWATIVIWIMALAALVAFLAAPTDPDRWLLSAPSAMFAGWLTAAAAVSTGVLIGGYGVLGNTGAALAMLVLVLGLALVIQWQKPRMPVYGLTVVWALVGIIAANAGVNRLVAGAAAAGILVLLVALVLMRRGRPLAVA